MLRESLKFKEKAMPILSTTVVKQAGHQLSCKLDNEVAILNMKTTLYFGLDEVGAFIWQSIQNPLSVGEICRAVIDRYEVDATQCRIDVLGFLNKLEEVSLIEALPSLANESTGKVSDVRTD
jgi:hypothetical protein